jgi:hypothetical protein
MNNKYTFNNFSVFLPIDTSLSITKNKNIYTILPKKSYNCGNIIDSQENNINSDLDNNNIFRPKTIQQYYQSKFCKYPIMPLEQKEGLQKWENNQPIKYQNNNYVNFSNNQFEIDQLDSYKILDKYDHNNLYSHYFFIQKDRKLNSIY